MVLASADLRHARASVALCADGEVRYLALRSRVDPGQSLLLPVWDELLCGGFSLFTPFGGLHAWYWSLAYGSGGLDERHRIRFESGTLRHGRVVEVAPVMLGGLCWVADVEGLFARAVLFEGDRDVARTPLADRW